MKSLVVLGLWVTTFSGCASDPAQIAGDYTVGVTNRDNGCNFPNCPRTSIYEASERDLRIMLVSDAISGLYDQGRSELENIGVVIADTDACLAWLHG